MSVVVVLLGFFGVFSQVFNGVILPGIAIASISSILVGVTLFTIKNNRLVIALSMAAFIGCVYDAFQYFTSDHVYGNYYGGWIFSVPLIISLLVIIKMVSNVDSGSESL